MKIAQLREGSGWGLEEIYIFRSISCKSRSWSADNLRTEKAKQQGTGQTKPVDTMPKVEVVKATPKKAEPISKKKPAKKKTPVRDWLFGRKK